MKHWHTIICLIFSLSALFTPLAQANQHALELNDLNINDTFVQNIYHAQDMAPDIDSCQECIEHSNTVICQDFCLSMTPAILVEITVSNECFRSNGARSHLERCVGLSPAVEISPPINL
ncbi:hypothetical protein [Kiloniella majae]|uniref:hypothetical protein n=1 Tax=Kiloniella majae TaxID=1938558 RepID=UPI000F769DBA|nr:hypothetical protein [Kiloniella majae]